MRFLLVVVVGLLISGASFSANAPNPYGRFVGNLDLRLEGDRNGRLLNIYMFIDSDNKQWTAPKGALVNGASIPQALWTIIGSPWTGLYRDASVIHDVYCDNRYEPWKAVHKVFYRAMLAKGVHPLQAKVMYAAVYRFGPRWDVVYKTQKCADCAVLPFAVKSFTPTVDEAEMSVLKAKIEASDPSIEQIEAEIDQSIMQELITKKLGTPILVQ